MRSSMEARTPCLHRCSTKSTASPSQQGVEGTDSEEIWMITEESAILVMSTSLLGKICILPSKEAHFMPARYKLHLVAQFVGYGVSDASLWACLIRDVTTAELAAEPPRALASTRRFADGFAAFQAFRPRWHIEDDTYRELKEGWGLEKQHWGRDLAAAVGRTTLTCLAFNTAQVYRLRAGEHLAVMAIRRLRRRRQRELGSAPAVIYLAGCYGVFALEELLSLLGSPARESLLPAVKKTSSPDAPT